MANVPMVFRVYTQVSLIAPTFIAVVLVGFDYPVPHPTTFGVWLALGLLWAQQLATLVSGGFLPSRRWWSGWAPQWFTHPVAIGFGLLLGLGLLWFGGRETRPLWLWSLPYAVSLANVTLILWHRRLTGASARFSPLSQALLLAAGAAPVGLALTLTGLWQGLMPLLVIVAAMLIQVGQVWWLDVVEDLENSRDTAAALARTQERLRFAGDLHDLQGHELQNIVLQADLARTLLRRHNTDAATSDAAVEGAAQILDSIHATAAGTLRQTRAIAHGYRKVSFTGEVTAAQDVLSAAGVSLVVSGSLAQIPATAEHFAGLLVREAATNLLRYSTATTAKLTVRLSEAGTTITISDPGPARGEGRFALPPGAGLTSLAERCTDAGMKLTFGPLPGSGWTVALMCPQQEDLT